VVSLEVFVRLLVSSLPQARLATRFPDLMPVFERMMRVVVKQRGGIPYNKEMLKLAPTPVSVGQA
jgi:hypothetical protein